MTRLVHIWLVLGIGLLAVHLPTGNVELGTNAVAALHPGEVVAEGNVQMDC